MRQAVFIAKHDSKWKIIEDLLKGKQEMDADELADMYIAITDDLAYTRTFYPDGKLLDYLNDLAFRLHTKIYSNKRERKNRVSEFWARELPIIHFKHRSKILISCVIFIIAISIGLFSAYMDSSFPTMIMGDSYINMTLENINNGDPMAVYKGGSESSMFFGIGINNVYVSFLAFALGILASVVTGYILFTNGIMVGAFIYFFVDRGLFTLSVTTIMIHGTLELSAIIIAGAAGMVLGNSWLFPGTYARVVSLKKGARDAVKIIIGLVPVFIFAALLESFVTRHYLLLGLTGRMLIIFSTLIFVIWYYVLYPVKVIKSVTNSVN